LEVFFSFFFELFYFLFPIFPLYSIADFTPEENPATGEIVNLVDFLSHPWLEIREQS